MPPELRNFSSILSLPSPIQVPPDGELRWNREPLGVLGSIDVPVHLELQIRAESTSCNESSKVLQDRENKFSALNALPRIQRRSVSESRVSWNHIQHDEES
jgi:hypothetical protein